MKTTIYINGNEKKLDGDMLFGELIEEINSGLDNKSSIISKIKIGDNFIYGDIEDKYSKTKLKLLDKIDLYIADPLDLAFEALSSSTDYIKKIIAQSQKTGALYEHDVPKRLVEPAFVLLVNGLNNLAELLASAQYIVRTRLNTSGVDESPLRIAQARLTSAIRELLPAKEENNRELLADVLSKEIPEALMELMDEGLPVLHKMKPSN